jgi:hypothetical protein
MIGGSMQLFAGGSCRCALSKSALNDALDDLLDLAFR